MSKNDNYWGIGFALFGGMFKYFHSHFLQVSIGDWGFFLRAGSAFIVAVLCAIGGVIGKKLAHYAIRKFNEKWVRRSDNKWWKKRI